MNHRTIRILLGAVFLLSAFTSSADAQKKAKASVIPHPPPQSAPPIESTPNHPTMVAIDAPPPDPALLHPFTLNMSELKFGSQGTGVQSCVYVTITNNGASAQTMTALYTDDPKHYTIPSPSHEMLPISVQPRSSVTISVCFKPEKVGEFKTQLVIKTPEDSIAVPIDGKGIKPEDVGKLPKTDMSFVWKKKGRDGRIKLQLISSSKVTLQLFDDLGNLTTGFLNNDFKNEGVYEIPFDGTDKEKKKLSEGSYYLRCVIDDVTRGSMQTKITKVVEMPD